MCLSTEMRRNTTLLDVPAPSGSRENRSMAQQRYTEDGDVTLVTTCSVDRIDRLRALMAAWVSGGVMNVHLSMLVSLTLHWSPVVCLTMTGRSHLRRHPRAHLNERAAPPLPPPPSLPASAAETATSRCASPSSTACLEAAVREVLLAALLLCAPYGC